MRKMSRKMKLMSGLISAAAALTLITGCGSSAGAGAGSAPTAETAENAAQAVTEEAADGTHKMAYVVSTRDEYLGLLEGEVLDAAKKHNVDMEVFYAGNDALKMIDCVEAAKSKGKEAVLINLHASEEAQACIEAAGDMKVVFVNREPSDYSVLNDNAVFVGSDEHTSGRAQGEYLADYFKSIGKTDVSYILLRGTEGLVHTNLRSEEAIKAMEEAGLNLTEAAVVEGEYDRNTAKSEMDVVLPNLDFDCVISNNDAMALGALLAMNDAGIEPGSVPVVGIDATEDGRNAIRSGEMAMTVFQSAKGQAEGSVVAAVNMLEGKSLGEGTGCEVSETNANVLFFPFIPVTAENVDDI